MKYLWVRYSLLSSYPGYFLEPHWKSIGLPEISRVTWQVWIQYIAGISRSNIYDIACNKTSIKALHRLDSELTKHTPYLALTDEIWGVFCEISRKMWLRYSDSLWGMYSYGNFLNFRALIFHSGEYMYPFIKVTKHLSLKYWGMHKTVYILKMPFSITIIWKSKHWVSRDFLCHFEYCSVDKLSVRIFENKSYPTL